MSPSVPLVEALLALSALLAVLAGATAARKGQRALWTRRRARLEEAARPHLLAVLAGEPPHEPRDLPAPVGKVFEELAISFLPKLRGSDRETLVSILVQRDALARARRRATRPGAVGRARAAELLGAAGDQHALPVLTRLLADRDPEVRTVAARALGKLGAPAVAPLLAALEARRSLPASVVTMALVHAGAGGAEALIAGLDRSRSPRVRAVAAELLGELWVLAAVSPLTSTLQHDPEPAARLAAARSLGRLGVPEAARPLLAALDAHEPPALRAAAAEALGRIGGAVALDALTRLLASPNHDLASAAAGGMAACGEPGLAALREASGKPASARHADAALAQAALRSARRRDRQAVAA